MCGLAVALVAGGCGGRHAPSRPSPPAGAKPSLPSVPPGVGTLVAQVFVRTTMRSAPGGHVLARIGPRDQFGSPNDLAVVSVERNWVGVLSAFAGNGRVGWIPRSSAVLYRVPYILRLSLSGRSMTVLYRGSIVKRYRIGIGASWAPTPTGRFAVTDRLSTGESGGPYGCCILALSATAPHAIPGWTGGNRIAIHATPATQTIGQPDSHGCIHVDNTEGRWLIDHVPIGTPTLISR